MKTVGISSEDQESIFRILAGILHIGNIEFRPAGQDKAQVSDKSRIYDILHHLFIHLALVTAANLLGLSEQDLESALLTRHITSGSARSSTYAVPLNVESVCCIYLPKTNYAARHCTHVMHLLKEYIQDYLIGLFTQPIKVWNSKELEIQLVF